MAHKKKVSIREKKKKRENTLVILPKTSLLRSTKGTLFPRCYFFFPFCVVSEAKRRAELPEEAFNHKLKVLL